MSNMSYCRFENTASDLADCCEALGGMIEGTEEIPSRSELKAMMRLVAQAAQLIELVNQVLPMEADVDDVVDELQNLADGPLEQALRELEVDSEE